MTTSPTVRARNRQPGGRHPGGRTPPATLRNQSSSGATHEYPPNCVAVGPIPIRTLAAQIWAFCAREPERQGSLAYSWGLAGSPQVAGCTAHARSERHGDSRVEVCRRTTGG